MSAVTDFPERLRSTPSATRGSHPAQGGSEARTLEVRPFTSNEPYVAGPFHPNYPSGLNSLVAQTAPRFASGGFRPNSLDAASDGDDEAICREPQSVVVTAMLVGLVLAGMGYVFGIQ